MRKQFYDVYFKNDELREYLAMFEEDELLDVLRSMSRLKTRRGEDEG